LKGWIIFYTLRRMQTKIKFYSIVLLSLVWIEAGSQVPATPLKDVPGFRTRLETMSDKVSTIESDFIQEKNLSMLANKIVSRGHFWYKKENNIRWEYVSPYKYLIIITNDQIFIKEDKSQKQYDIQSNAMFREMNKFISGCIQGDILKNEKDYRVGYFEDEKSYFVTLVPNDAAMRRMLNEVQIWFDKRDLTVSRINMVEAGGDYTNIEFTAKKLNTVIPIEKFDFN
jgi:outer membrane lipoprotein-sorting protein